MSEEKINFIKQWLEVAGEDMKVYEFLIKDEIPFLASAGFHLQQSAEKYLKAFLEYKSIKFPKTHDVEFLLQQCAQIEYAFSGINYYNLSDYAVDLRYPGNMQPPSKGELKQAYESVQEIKQLVL